MLAYRRYAIGILLLLYFAVAASGQSIYKTPSGKKYHLGNCRMVKNVSEKITPEKAKALGLEACLICRPNIDNLKFSTENKAKGESASVQCRGITKKGTRCKHNTHIANGYCFQHQPKE
jgi:hypothetical protein